MRIFYNAVYSASIGADTITRANGHRFIHRFLDCIAGDRKSASSFLMKLWIVFYDIRVERMYRRIFCDSVNAVARVKPSRQEFMLLMAILYCNSGGN